jgi:hypothetical protein
MPEHTTLQGTRPGLVVVVWKIARERGDRDPTTPGHRPTPSSPTPAGLLPVAFEKHSARLRTKLCIGHGPSIFTYSRNPPTSPTPDKRRPNFTKAGRE